MKAMSILGSPRKGGNTAKLLGWVEDELRRLGHEVDRADIVDYSLSGCRECYRCQSVLDEPGCSVEDDMMGLFDRVFDADAVILASPVFCWGFTAQLKPFGDRLFCMMKGVESGKQRSLLAGKPLALVVTAAGPRGGNADRLLTTTESLAGALQTRLVACLIAPGCKTPEMLGEGEREQARKFVVELTEAVGA